MPVLPVPSAILDCVRCAVEGGAFDQHILHRLLLCGQWVVNAPGCGQITLAEAGVLTHPHKDRVRVYTSETGNASGVMSPPPCWKRVVGACGLYCAGVFDMLADALGQGKGLSRSEATKMKKALPHLVSTVS